MLPAALLTGLLLIAVGFTLEGIGLSTCAVTLLLALFVLPASEAALGLFNTVASLLVEPTRLIGYEYKDGVPAHARTLVALPILIGSRDDVEDALHNLEVHYLANMQGELDFAHPLGLARQRSGADASRTWILDSPASVSRR